MIKHKKYIDLLIQLLAIPSLSRKEDTRATFLQSWLARSDIKAIRSGNNLIISEVDPAAARVLLNSHIDTVPPGEGWNTDPYLPLVEDDKITGLGSNDAGASVVSLLGAYDILRQEGLAKDMVLVLSAEEEVSGKNGLESVLPILENIEFAVVGEPTGMQGAIAERGLMVVDALAKGKSGHAARKEGVNAIYKAIADLQMIHSLEFPEKSDFLEDPSVNVTMINAGKKHNLIPDTCEYVVDVRSNDKYTNKRILKMLESCCEAELTPRSLRLMSSFLPEGHFIIDVLKNMEIPTYGSPTLSDMAILRIPALKIGPGNSARSHTANEYICKKEIEEGIDLYVQLFKEVIKTAL